MSRAPGGPATVASTHRHRHRQPLPVSSDILPSALQSETASHGRSAKSGITSLSREAPSNSTVCPSSSTADHLLSPSSSSQSTGTPHGSANFALLRAHDPLLRRLGVVAEPHAQAEPNSSLLKSRQIGEALLLEAAGRARVDVRTYDSQLALTSEIKNDGRLGSDSEAVALLRLARAMRHSV